MKTAPAKTKKKVPAKKVDEAKEFTLVAIGASAGGLEAISDLLVDLPSDTGMAFIYVQHLSPDHKSMLTTLLSKVTTMHVLEVEDKVLIESNMVYVIPPDKEITVTAGHIAMTPRPASPKIRLPIDILFSSIAESHKDVIGIILSGSGSDGSVGLKSIKLAGGLTFAQDETAKFNSMPKAAIASGAVDFILSPKEIALELARLSGHPFIRSNGRNHAPEDKIENSNPDLHLILNYLLKSTNVDFSAYKLGTVKRRIIRRMLLNKLNSLKIYAEMLATRKDELAILYQDLLINVTSFFRDADTYTYLKKNILPKLIKRKNSGDSIRIWVPACSTGEEALSIAMMILEIQDTSGSEIPVQIFGTDLSDKAIYKARAGLYSKSDLESVSPQRIRRFFTTSEGGFRINKFVRNMCVFATHNILIDPPFSRIDFISCRNLFIYLDSEAQKRAINVFHYALNEEGYLMLGKSETISGANHLFSEVQKQFKIYCRKGETTMRMSPFVSPGILLPGLEIQMQEGNPGKPSVLAEKRVPDSQRSLEQRIDEVLLSNYMPACVVINSQCEILHFRGNTDLYFSHSQGKASLNVLKLARKELVLELRKGISEVLKTNKPVKKVGIEMKSNADRQIIGIELAPLAIEWGEPLLLILFTEHEQKKLYVPFGLDSDEAAQEQDQRIHELEVSLAAAHADALLLSNEQEAFIEELQSANQEVVSSNEELQTVNEELETSKEEIESTNEELTTTNQELQTRNDLLNESYDYSKAIISTLHDPLVVLDSELRIKTANQSFYKIFNVSPAQTEGLLLYDLGDKHWDIPRLRELLEDIIPQKSFFNEFEVQHTFPGIGHKILKLNASRLVQKSHGEQLILLSIKDVTEAVRLQNKERELLNKEFEESKNYGLRLEKAVSDRTIELNETNKSLAENIVELEEMNHELEAFTYVSSHDLQEPLRKIQTFSDLILNKEAEHLSKMGKTYFQYIQLSAERMQMLIRDLLLFSRISTTERKFEFVELKQLIDHVKAEFEDGFRAHKAGIEVKGSCEVYIIPFLFMQVFQNLFANAIKFSKPDIPLEIRISCKSVSGSQKKKLKLDLTKDYCHIRMTDNGIGFDNMYHEKIFEIFQRLHSKDAYPGTGIGLAIVRKIITNHNGLVAATGKPGKGATFNIYIPSKP
jgi:two-component system CheB/CheR fusion protein